MNELFGLPMSDLLVGCLTLFALCAGVIAVLSVRNRILFKLALRKVGRRPGRTALVVVGLMLATTIITAAFSTGDTMTHTVRASTLKVLGEIDEVVSAKGSGAPSTPGQAAANQAEYFDQSLFQQVRDAAAGVPEIDGVAPLISEAVAVQDTTTRQNEPVVVLFASTADDLRGFGSLKLKDGPDADLSALAPGEVYLNAKAGDELDASPGDELLVFAAGQARTMKVRSIVDYAGTGTDGSAIIMELSAAQALLDKPGQINRISISNQGDASSGVGRTGAVIAALEPKLAPLGLEIDPTKKDQLKLADDLGSVFTTAFATFGSFSVVAGVMLIFLIFVMVAAERKPEMGIARAVGTQRSQLVQMFTFEGIAYDLVAAAIGALLGVIIAAGMVFVMAQAFGSEGVRIEHDIEPRSLVIAYTMGVVLTFAVVTFSAWKVSVLNIVTAIRNLPERERKGKGSGSRWLGPALLLAGVLLVFIGIAAKQQSPYYLGVAVVMMSFIPILRRLGAGDRVAYSVAGLGITIFTLLPSAATDWFLPAFSVDFSIFVIGGTLAVVGATWVVMYNSELILGSLMAVFGRFRLMAPVVKTSVARALNNRFRTGMAVAMFSLVVLTLVVMATVTGAVWSVLDDADTFDGGFDISATTLRINPVTDMDAAIQAAPGLERADFTRLSQQSILSVKVRQVGASSDEFKDYLIRGDDSTFLRGNTFDFTLKAPEYATSADVWAALDANPDLAVIDATAIPSRTNFNVGVVGTGFTAEGVYLDDKVFKPFEVEVQDPFTEATRRLTVIGVLRNSLSPLIYGLSTSQATMEAAFGDAAVPTIHLFDLREGVNAGETAKSLEAAFVMNGMNAEALRKQQQDIMSASLTFNYMLQGFMGLGLVVGVAALGVISARSVVERRQQIGVLRAIGFQKGMVELSFLLESSFIALLGIAVGTLLGLVIAANVIHDFSQTGGHGDLPFAVPWLNLAVIFGAAYAVALLTTFLPARRASQIYPAEALRYE